MATGGLLALLDDIATVLDDVSAMTKVAAKKTAGVLGDDLALNAEQVSGVRADRELPVVWAVAKGSFVNKLILVPLALLIGYFIPWLITPLLMIGGAYLCYEGVEKLAHKFLHRDAESDHQEQLPHALIDKNADLLALEKDKIKDAIRTDFVLSAEIIVIALGTVKDASFATQTAVVSAIALLMTVGVYGLVAGIVKLDDGGLALIRSTAQSVWGRIKRSLGYTILWFAPNFMKILSIVGTLAMFLVGGGILLHGLPHAHAIVHQAGEIVGPWPLVGGLLKNLVSPFLGLMLGLIAGMTVLIAVTLLQRIKGS